MSYYSIAPSYGWTGSRQLTATPKGGQNTEQQNALMNPTGGFRYRGVDAPETVQSQISGLMNPANDFVTRARSAGIGHAQSRGLANSSLAAANSEGAALDAALPIASQDAATYAKTHSDNMDAENRALLANLDADTAIRTASMNAGTSLDIANINAQSDKDRLAAQDKQWAQQFAREGTQFDQARNDANQRYATDWQHQQDLAGQQHQWNQQDFAQQNQAQRQNFTQSSIMNTIFSDPSYWRDPQAAMNFASTYGTNFTNMWNQLFGGQP